MLDAGVPLKYAQSRLGQSNINMTAHYQHLTKKADVIVIEKIHAHINRKNFPGVKPKMAEKLSPESGRRGRLAPDLPHHGLCGSR